MSTDTHEIKTTDEERKVLEKYSELAQQTPLIEASRETRANSALLACAQVGTLEEFQYLFERDFQREGVSREAEYVVGATPDIFRQKEFLLEDAVRVALYFGNRPVTEYLFRITRGRMVATMCKYHLGTFSVPDSEFKFFLGLLRRYPHPDAHELISLDNLLSLTPEEAHEDREMLRGFFEGWVGIYFESLKERQPTGGCSFNDKIKLLEYFPEEVLLEALLEATTEWMEITLLLEHRPSLFQRDLAISGREPDYGWDWESDSSTPEEMRAVLSDLRGPLRFFKK